MTTRGMRYGIPGDFGKRPGTIEVVVYGCAPPDTLPGMPEPPFVPAPSPGPEPAPPGSYCNLVEAVRQRLAEARQSRSILDAEIETLERMLAAAERRQ